MGVIFFMKNQKGISLIAFLIVIVILLLGTFLLREYLYAKADKMQAEYEARFHTVSFDTDGGNYISPKKVKTFDDISNIYAKKDGYIFEGWLLDGQLIDVNSYIPLTQDVTVKASYRKKVDTTNNSINSSSSNNSSNSNKNYNNDKNTSNIQTQTENKKTYNINARKTAKLFPNGDIALTVMNYQTETYNSKVGGVENGQEWVIINVKFENKSDSTIIINKSDFRIVDGAGRYEYRPTYKHLDTELDMVEVRAGQTTTFSIRFVYYQNNEMSLRYYNSDLYTGSYDEYIDLKLR